MCFHSREEGCIEFFKIGLILRHQVTYIAVTELTPTHIARYRDHRLETGSSRLGGTLAVAALLAFDTSPMHDACARAARPGISEIQHDAPGSRPAFSADYSS